MFDESDEAMSIEDPGFRCMVWGWRRAEALEKAILAETLDQLPEDQQAAFLRIYGQAVIEVKQKFLDNPLEPPAWFYGEAD